MENEEDGEEEKELEKALLAHAVSTESAPFDDPAAPRPPASALSEEKEVAPKTKKACLKSSSTSKFLSFLLVKG